MFPCRGPIERDAPFPEPSICLSKSLVNELPSRFPNGALMEMPISRAFLYTSFRVPSKAIPTPGSPSRAPIERYTLIPEPSVIYLLESPLNESPPQCPQWGPYGERRLFPEPSFTHLLKKSKSHLSFKVPGTVAPLPCYPIRAPMKTCSVSRANG
jgi:hypothetical protein